MHPMTPDQLYQIAIGAVVSALIWSVNMLWKRSEECEKWRNKAAPIINQMQNMIGMATGTINLVDQCSQDKCPFAGKLSEMNKASMSLKKDHDKHPDPL